MKPVFTSDEMKRCDARAIEDFGLPGIALMENASMGSVELLEQEKGAVANKRFFILCGPGNNGGDGFAIARHLINRYAEVLVFTLKPDKDHKGDAAVNLGILRKMFDAGSEDLRILHISAIDEFTDAFDNPPDMIVDALLGTGLNTPVRGLMEEIIEFLPETGIPVFAVDIPSGINADNGSSMGSAVLADMTATMGGLKRGLLLSDGKVHCGDIHVIDIGTPIPVYEDKQFQTHLLEEPDIGLLLPWRSPIAHKYEVGSVFVLAGSTGLSGAAALASEATLRAGAGIVKLGIPASLNAAMESKLTEVMTLALPETSEGSFSTDALERAIEYLNASDIGVIGPGLGRNNETLEFARDLIRKSAVPLVIDADGLYALVDNLDVLPETKHTHILTPHYGEFCRLLGISRKELEMNPIELAREFAHSHKVILVLKGPTTITAVPQGSIYLNSTGNAGMATAGAGDVLTGIIAGFLAQFHDDWAAAITAVCVHGSAGDIASSKYSELSMTATNILDALPKVLKQYYS
jgi:ADP-dependent NAD(P)H-hydrate dehydratase / NAD(P)H-hydrate epimerase